MFTASNIVYHIDDEAKTITASATGMKFDAVDTVLKALRKENVILSNSDFIVAISAEEDGTVKDEGIEINELPLCTCGHYLLPNELSARAKYDPSDHHPYDVERGKQIARRRLYDTYNHVYMNALINLQCAIDTALTTHITQTLELTRDRIKNFQYFEHYDIFKANCDCNHSECDKWCDECTKDCESKD